MPAWKRFFYSKWFIIIGSLIVIFLLVALGRSFYQQNQIQQEISRLQEETKQLEAKKIETLELLRYTHTPAFIEEKARTELNLIKPGEKVSIIKNTRKIESNRQNKEVVLSSSTSSNPIKWFNYFFGKKS